MPIGVYKRIKNSGGWKIKDTSKMGHPAWNKGQVGNKLSEETRNKMSISRKGRKFSEETRAKIGLANSISQKGKKLSEETKRKISLNHRTFQTKETIAKISNSMKGDKCYNYQGGISNNLYCDDWIESLRNCIRQRDNYICQECGIHQDEIDNGRIKKLDVHHIDYNKLNCNPDNLITLCRNCHMKTNFNREYWKQYFIII